MKRINRIAPEHRRAEVVASYMIVCFLGNSLPVIGVGVLSKVAGHAMAHAVFAVTIAALALIALATGWKQVPENT